MVIDTTPGTVCAYSNVGTELMGHILEQVYDQSFEGLLQQHLFGPAEMPQAAIQLDADAEKQLANGYGEGRQAVPPVRNLLWGAAGGVCATMPDVINYIKWQLDTTNPIVQRTHTILYQDELDAVGYYWPIRSNDIDGTHYAHHGGSFGTQNWLSILPRHNMGLSIITNQSDPYTARKLMTTLQAILDDIR